MSPDSWHRRQYPVQKAPVIGFVLEYYWWFRWLVIWWHWWGFRTRRWFVLNKYISVKYDRRECIVLPFCLTATFAVLSNTDIHTRCRRNSNSSIDHDSLDAFHVVSLAPLAWRWTVSWRCRHTNCSLPPVGHVHKPAAVFIPVREQLEYIAFVWPQQAASLAGSSGEVRCVSVRCFCPFSLPFELKVPWDSIVTQFFASWVLQRSERR